MDRKFYKAKGKLTYFLEMVKFALLRPYAAAQGCKIPSKEFSFAIFSLLKRLKSGFDNTKVLKIYEGKISSDVVLIGDKMCLQKSVVLVGWFVLAKVEIYIKAWLC